MNAALPHNLVASIREQIVVSSGLPADFRDDAHIYHELGVSSVDAMQLLLALEERYGISIPDEDFVEATTLNQLAALVFRLSAAPPS